MRQPPTGTVTFLFTDVEGSTHLWELHSETMRAALARHDQILRQSIVAKGGYVFKTMGDAFCAAFRTAPEAVQAALAAQVALGMEAWPTETSLRVRMALHTGTAEEREGDYLGQPLNRVARLLALGHGGQTLLSGATQELTRDHLPPAASLLDLGQRRLKDLGHPETVFQLLHPELPAQHPPLRTLDNPDLPNTMPRQASSLQDALSEERPIPPLTVRLFGAFGAHRDGAPLPGLHLREGERLLAYLTLHAGDLVPTRELARRFWPAEAQGSLDGQGDFPCVRQAVRALRQALGPDAGRLIRPSRATIRLDLSGVEADVLAFDRLIHAGADAAAAVLYRGPLLDGWPESWAGEARAQRRGQYESALRRLAEQAERVAMREEWLCALVVSRPDDEEAGRSLLRLLAEAGRHADARAAQERLLQAVAAAGRTPAPETDALGEELRRLRGSVRTAVPPPAVPLEAAPLALDAPGGSVPVQSHFYVVRATDADFLTALSRRDSVVLVKGARQVGKTSLLARGLQQARAGGARVVLTDFQKLNGDQLASPEALYRALGADIARQLGVAVSPRAVWDDDFGPNMNMELFLRLHVLPAVPQPLVWGMDEIDRLFSCPFGSEVFGLFRSWHNERALDPDSALCRVTLAIAYATEAHLFITDPNQSPFNVGTRLSLSDFTPAQIDELHARYGSPWSSDDLGKLMALVGGQPYLVRLGLDRAARGLRPAEVEAEARGGDGPLAEHLQRLGAVLERAPEQREAVRGLLAGVAPPPEAFFRLRAAGLLDGPSSQEARFRCRLYADYFARRLAPA